MTGSANSPGETSQLAGWRVTVATSGGLVGVGRGSVAAESTGKLFVSGPTRPGRSAGSRERRLSEPELQRIAAAVQGSRPSGWASTRLEQAAPDAFGYVLELRRGASVDKAVWHDNTRDDLPADLAELYASLETVWSSVNENRD